MNITRKNILKFIEKKGVVTPAEISQHFLLGRAMVHRHLAALIESEDLKKTGSAPRVFYKINSESKFVATLTTKAGERKVLEDNFLYVRPSGERMVGVEAFVSWCLDRGFDGDKKKDEYFKILKKYEDLRDKGLFDATNKIKKTFEKVCVKGLYYVDFYSVEVFGKTRLGQMILYTKQSQDRKGMKNIVDEVRLKIERLVKDKKIQAIVFVPPTVKREHQFMTFLSKEIALNIPRVEVIKNKNDVAVPQKTLKKLSDRIENARETFVVSSTAKYDRVLVIDDAVGSGASINEIACKLKVQGIVREVYGLALVGSLNDFEVISEV